MLPAISLLYTLIIGSSLYYSEHNSYFKVHTKTCIVLTGGLVWISSFPRQRLREKPVTLKEHWILFLPCIALFQDWPDLSRLQLLSKQVTNGRPSIKDKDNDKCIINILINAFPLPFLLAHFLSYVPVPWCREENKPTIIINLNCIRTNQHYN